MDKLIQKRRGVLGLLLLIALILPVMGCQQQEVYLEDLLPRDSVQQAAVNYLNIGVGENIPRVDYASGTSPVRPAAQPSLRRGARSLWKSLPIILRRSTPRTRSF